MIINDVNSIMRWQTKLLPDGYTELSWIGAGANGPYLNTNIYPDANTGFEIDYQLTSISQTNTYNTVFGAANTGSGTPGYILMVQSNGWAGFRKGSGIQFTLSSQLCNTNRHKVSYDNSSCVADENVITRSTSDNLTVTLGNSIYIFARHQGGALFGASKWMKLYSFRMWNTSTNAEMCRLIPAMRDSDSVVGAYDLVQGVFRTNQGTGTFTYG